MFFFFFSLFLIEYQLITNIPAGARDIEIRDMNGAGHFLGKLDFVTCFVQCVQSTDIQRKPRTWAFFYFNMGLKVESPGFSKATRHAKIVVTFVFAKTQRPPIWAPLLTTPLRGAIMQCLRGLGSPLYTWYNPGGTISCWRWCRCHLAVAVPVCQLY